MSDIQTAFVTQTTASAFGVPHIQTIDPVVTVSTTYTATEPDNIEVHNVKAFIPVRPVDVSPPAPKYNDYKPQIPQNPGYQNPGYQKPGHQKPGDEKPEKPEIEIEIPDNDDDSGSAAIMSFPIFGIIFLAFASILNIV